MHKISRNNLENLRIDHQINHILRKAGLIRKPVNMPMVGVLTRLSKKRDEHGQHMFALDMRFKQSKRYYGYEYLYAVDKRAALKQVHKMYPFVEMVK